MPPLLRPALPRLRDGFSVNLPFSLFVLSLAFTATVGGAIKPFLLPCVALWGLSTVLLLRRRRARPRWPLLLGLLYSVGLTLLVTGVSTAFFQKGFLSYTPDTFSYCAFGQYLNDYPRGTEGGLAFVDQYASHLSITRFGTPSLLAAFHDLTGLSVPRALIVWWFVVQTNAFFGYNALGRAFGLSRRLAFGLGTVYLLSGWTCDALLIGSLDNLLFMSLLPGVLYSLVLFRRARVGLPAAMLFAVPAAACFYVYPEGLALAVLLLSPFLVRHTFPLIMRLGRRTSTRLALAGYVVTLCLLTLPYANQAWTFLHGQLQITGLSARPGEGTFPSIWPSDARGLPALFAFGNEFGQPSRERWYLRLSTLLALTTVVAVAWPHHRRLPRFSLLLIAAAFIDLAVLQRYNYGAFKLLLLGLPFWAALILRQTAGWVARLMPVHRAEASVAAALALCLFLPRVRTRGQYLHAPDLPLSLYERLASVPRQAAGCQVSLECNDGMHSLWAALFLREANLVVPERPLYFALPHVQRLLDRSKSGPVSCLLVVVEAWSGAHPRRAAGFTVVRSTDSFWLTGLHAPNGVEHGPDGPFFWLDDRPVTIDVDAAEAQPARLTCSSWGWGPDAAPGPGVNCVDLTLDGVRASPCAGAPPTFPVLLHPGRQTLTLSCQVAARKDESPQRDPRKLLVRINALRLTRAGAR